VRRAVIFTTLAFLLLTVTGITVAQQRSSKPEMDNQKMSDQTVATVQEAKNSKPTEPSSEGSNERNESAVEDAAQNSDEPKPAKPKATGDKADMGKKEKADKQEEARKTGDVDKPSGKDKPASGKPSGKGRAIGIGKIEDPEKSKGKHKGTGRAQGNKGKGEAKAEAKGGEGQQKVTLCHKGKNTIRVGIPAKDAHLRHGDSLGTCGQQ
jgi:cytoskeletal protein RodZ